MTAGTNDCQLWVRDLDFTAAGFPIIGWYAICMFQIYDVATKVEAAIRGKSKMIVYGIVCKAE